MYVPRRYVVYLLWGFKIERRTSLTPADRAHALDIEDNRTHSITGTILALRSIRRPMMW
jgi:hypothetical protein